MRRIIIIALLVLAVGCSSLPSQQAATHPAPTYATQRNEVTVYITDTGERYHVSSCRYLRYSKHPVALGEAKSRGYTPCKVCQPPR
jgi:competence protein ComEC